MNAADIEDVARRHGIVLLLQFGFAVTGRTHPYRDLDLAVLLEHASLPFDANADLVGDLQALVPGQPADVAVL